MWVFRITRIEFQNKFVSSKRTECRKTLSLSFITKCLRYFRAGYTRNYDQQDNNTTSSDAKEMGEDSFALPSSSKWEVADRQEKMGKNNLLISIFVCLMTPFRNYEFISTPIPEKDIAMLIYIFVICYLDNTK